MEPATRTGDFTRGDLRTLNNKFGKYFNQTEILILRQGLVSRDPLRFNARCRYRRRRENALLPPGITAALKLFSSFVNLEKWSLSKVAA